MKFVRTATEFAPFKIEMHFANQHEVVMFTDAMDRVDHQFADADSTDQDGKKAASYARMLVTLAQSKVDHKVDVEDPDLKNYDLGA